MHNRIKALIVAAMIISNTASPAINVLADEIDKDTVNEEVMNAVDIEEYDNLGVDSEKLSSESDEITNEKTETPSILEETSNLEETNVLEETNDLEQTNVLEESNKFLARGLKKFEIQPNNEPFDWGYGTSNEVEVLLEFDNQTNKKVVEIELPEGMVFERYPVVGLPSDTVESEATQTELSVIKKVLEKPTQDPITGLYSGKLVYELNEGVMSGKIVFSASVDRYRYYKPQEIVNAINVKVEENDIEIDSKSINVQATNNTNIGAKNNNIYHSGAERTTQLQPGGTGNTYSYYRNTTSAVQTGDNGIRDFTLVEEVELIMYYPQHTKLVSVNNLPDKAVWKEDKTQNKVVINMPGETVKNFNISLTYQVDSKAPLGEIKSPDYNSMTVKYYDGGIESFKATTLDSVKIVDPSTVGPVIKMDIFDGYYHDYNGSSLSIGGYIYLNNKTIVDYNNQVFEYQFSGWNTRKVLLPDSMTGIVDIKYTVFGDSTEYSVSEN